MLERTSVTAKVTASPDGRDVAVEIACRALDLCVTYQDVKLIYSIVKSCERSSNAAGVMDTDGAKQIESMWAAAMQEEVQTPAVALPPPGREGVARVDLQVDSVTVCLINDCLGGTVPFGTVTVKDAGMSLVARSDLSSTLKCQATVEAVLYNVLNTCFEPVVEPWKATLSRSVEPGGGGVRTTVGSDHVLDVNISETHMRGLVQTMEAWMQDSKTWDADLAKEDPLSQKFWPYRLRNEAGTPFTFWLGSSLEPPEQGVDADGTPLLREVAIGGELAFAFPRNRGGQVRQRDMALQFHTLSIRFEGITDVLTHVPVDIAGVHMLPLGDLRAVAEIHSDSGAKIVAIQSIFKVYNKTGAEIEASVYHGEHGVSAWADTFAGDMHGCVPLAMVGCGFLRLRPAAGYELSNVIRVPTEPVTGQSIFVVSMPSAGTEGGPMHFRVRLDAKKPIGGHEERMRVVISVHPALRVQNCLPYPMQIGVHLGGKMITSVLPAEGVMEHLYCADLSQPLSMAAFLSHFRRGKEVLVYHPESSVAVAKTICIHDEAGLPLHLGIETTRSAWGDLTVCFFAQYLVLNFSSLPLRYGVFGGTTRLVRACAGQSAPSTPAASPQKGGMDDSADEFASSALKAIYAVFGPRSAFGGKLIASKPPAAEAELENAADLQGCVAVIIRGIVPFTEKARRAAAAGAVGVVFVNSDDSFFLAEGDSGPGIRLPCVMVSQSDGQRLLGEMGDGGEALRVTVQPQSGMTRQRASSMHLEWKRVVHCEVPFPSPSPPSALRLALPRSPPPVLRAPVPDADPACTCA